jgi:hypothetical protein
VHQGKVPPPPPGPIKISNTTLPEACSHELMRHWTKGIQLDVKKANRQIKALKKSLNMPSAKGLLVLCNSGNPFLTPHMIFFGLDHMLKDHYSSIEWILYMTHNLPVHSASNPAGMDLLVPIKRPGYDDIPAELSTAILDAWLAHISAHKIVAEVQTSDANFLFDAKH